MAVRIIAGEFGSRRLEAPFGHATRPTADRVKEALFSMLLPWLQGARVLDLFAGSGALALEAISRGAAFAHLCEQDREAAKVVQRNIAALGVQERAKLSKGNGLGLASRLAGEGERFDIIFLDPPYRAGLMPKALERCVALLAEGGVVAAESAWEDEFPPPEGLRTHTSRRYGECRVTLYLRDEGVDENP